MWISKEGLPLALVVDSHADSPTQRVAVGVAASPVGGRNGDEHLAGGVNAASTGPVPGIVVVSEVSREGLVHRDSQGEDAEGGEEEEMDGGRHYGRRLGLFNNSLGSIINWSVHNLGRTTLFTYRKPKVFETRENSNFRSRMRRIELKETSEHEELQTDRPHRHPGSLALPISCCSLYNALRRPCSSRLPHLLTLMYILSRQNVSSAGSLIPEEDKDGLAAGIPEEPSSLLTIRGVDHQCDDACRDTTVNRISMCCRNHGYRNGYCHSGQVVCF